MGSGARNGTTKQAEPAAGRAAPYDTSAAEALIGATLHRNSPALETFITLSPDDFYPPGGTHSQIAAAILSLHAKNMPTDAVTVAGEMRPKNLEEENRIIGELNSLMMKAPSTHNAEGYAARVRETKRQRQTITITERIRDGAYEGVDLTAAFAELDDLRTAAEGDDLPLAQLRRHLIVGDDIKSLPPLQPLIDGVLDMNTLAALYGPSGSGKSFVGIDWAMSVATGTWWHKHMVVPGRVLYVVAEGAEGVGPRVTAWQHHQQVHTAGGMYWVTMAPNLFDPRWAAALTQLAKGIPGLLLVVIDTLARSMVGADENSAKDMGMVISAADQVRRATGACVLMVHHSGKSIDSGQRGSSALKGAVDIEWECVTDDEGAVLLTSRKQKNRPDGEVVKLRKQPVGDSVALAHWTGSSPDGELPLSAVTMLETLYAVDLGKGVASAVWLEASKISKPTFWRWRKRLLELGMVVDYGKGRGSLYRLTPAGVTGAGLAAEPVDGALGLEEPAPVLEEAF